MMHCSNGGRGDQEENNVCCLHRVTVPDCSVSRFWDRCALCNTRIWNILNIVQCLDCGRGLHQSCSSTNRLCLKLKAIAESKTDYKRMARRDANQRCLSWCEANRLLAEAEMTRRAEYEAMSPEERRAVDRETRARKAMERQAAAKGDETRDRRPRSANARSDAPEPAPSSERAREVSRDGPPRAATDATSDFRRQDRNRNQRTDHGRRQNAGYRAWVPPQTTRVYDTSVPPTAVPPPPGPGKYWYGRQKFGPFVGPLMWNPVHERPRSFEMPAENEAAAAAPATRDETPAAPCETPAAAQQPFSYHVPGYMDGVGPVWYKVTVTP